MTTGIAYDIRALENDAQAWSCVSRRLERTSESATDLDAPASIFRCVASANAVATAYAQLLENAQTALLRGSEQAERGESALRDIAKDYRADEEAAIAAYEDLWEPLSS